MASFKSYKDIITEIKQLSEGIDSGSLNQDDLARFVDLSQKLYERAVILNYKAVESEVFKMPVIEKEKPDEEPLQSPAVIPETPSKPEVEPTILFDFSSELEEEITAEVTEETPMFDEEVGTEDDSTAEKDQPSSIAVTISNDDVNVFYEKFTKSHEDSLNDQFSNSRIEHLQSAFGLNDKMRIISELFDGDNTAFSDIIAELDQLSSGELARKRLSEVAVSRKWNPEDELVEEFIKTINRKFD
jgi:predicted CopG family antitoxin